MKKLLVSIVVIILIISAFAVFSYNSFSEEEKNEIVSVFNKYGLQYKLGDHLYTINVFPAEQMTDDALRIHYKNLKKLGEKEFISNFISERYPADNDTVKSMNDMKIVTLPPLSDGSDSYGAYDVMKAFLTELYENNNASYIMLTKDMENIYPQFISATSEFYKSGDWASVFKYYNENIFRSVQITEPEYGVKKFSYLLTSQVYLADMSITEYACHFGTTIEYDPATGGIKNIDNILYQDRTNNLKVITNGMSFGERNFNVGDNFARIFIQTQQTDHKSGNIVGNQDFWLTVRTSDDPLPAE